MPSSGSEPRYAWVMLVIGTVLVALNLGVLSSLSVFLKPISQEFGWPRGATALAYTIGAVTIGIAGVLWGRLADRYGTRPVVLVGAIAQPTALVLLAGISSLPQFYAAYVVLAALGVAAVNVPTIANVGLWFHRHQGTALGVLSAGGPLGQILVAFVAGHVIVSYGWRAAYLTLAVIYAVGSIPLAFMIRTPPVLAGAQVPGAVARASHPLLPAPLVVAWLSLATVFCCATMSVPIVHTVAMLTDRGMPYTDAVRVFLVIMGAGVFGRVLLGRITDHLGGLHSYFWTSLLQTVLLFWFLRVESMPVLYALSALFGIGYSGVMTAVWVCIRELVEPKVVAMSLAVVVMFAWFGMGLGGWHGGHAYDRTGSYTRPYLDAVGAGAVNLVIVGALIRRVSRARTLPVAQPAG
ncbi:MAG: MFS transporter [Candidatus Rokubacteria bacterium]|nr:MFS transporter [Candidatus Rokubacteria bacterium]